MDEDERRKLINEQTRYRETCNEWERQIAKLEAQGDQDLGYPARKAKIAALRADIGHLEERIELINDELA
jgi:polyhydroxyalkanoate synthesis regulator phasin